MKMWQRLLITLAAMLVASLIVAAVWGAIFEPSVPPYLSGVGGGLAALATWELLRPRKR
jgi:hypothetical protein